jgi:RNA polymerase sigma-70 factor (ECF subfamily)
MASPDTSKSLLDRARDLGDAASWRRLTDLYTPLIQRWVRPYIAQPADADDVIQEVLVAVARDLPGFRHNQSPGAFRAWLRGIAVNRLREYWRSRHGRIQATGGGDVDQALRDLEDPGSPLSRAWDLEHDRHVAQSLLESIRLEFQPATWQAFEEVVREGRPAAEVAAELGLSVNAVLIAKSRVLKRLRLKAGGLVD